VLAWLQLAGVSVRTRPEQGEGGAHLVGSAPVVIELGDHGQVLAQLDDRHAVLEVTVLDRGDVVGGGAQQAVRQVPQRTGRGELVADLGDVGIPGARRARPWPFRLVPIDVVSRACALVTSPSNLVSSASRRWITTFQVCVITRLPPAARTA